MCQLRLTQSSELVCGGSAWKLVCSRGGEDGKRADWRRNFFLAKTSNTRHWRIKKGLNESPSHRPCEFRVPERGFRLSAHALALSSPCSNRQIGPCPCCRALLACLRSLLEEHSTLLARSHGSTKTGCMQSRRLSSVSRQTSRRRCNARDKPLFSPPRSEGSDPASSRCGCDAR